MPCEVFYTHAFERDIKPLAKKYKSLKADVLLLVEALEQNPMLGDDLGNGVRKVRLAVKSKGKGKRAGARVITYAIIEDNEVYLLSIYDKSEKETIADSDLKALVELVWQLRQDPPPMPPV